MSKCISLPSTRMRMSMMSGSFTTPSESTWARPRYAPSGMVAILARICRAARARISRITSSIKVWPYLSSSALIRRAPTLQRRRLGLDVADALLRHADVGEDDGEDLPVDGPFLVELHGREAQALLHHFGGAGREAAGHHAAGIRPVAGVGEPGEVRALVEEGHGEAHVHQVGAAEVGVVDGEDVALADGGLRGDQVLGGELHGADEDRQPQLALRDQLAVLLRIDAVGAVEPFRDDRAEGRAHEGEVHLVAHLLQAALHHAEGDGVELARSPAHPPISRIKLPMASREARSPGSTTLVQSRCCTIAGPSKRAPAGRRSRS